MCEQTVADLYGTHVAEIEHKSHTHRVGEHFGATQNQKRQVCT